MDHLEEKCRILRNKLEDEEEKAQEVQTRFSDLMTHTWFHWSRP